MPSSWNRNRLTEKLGIDYPIIQGPLVGLPIPRVCGLIERREKKPKLRRPEIKSDATENKRRSRVVISRIEVTQSGKKHVHLAQHIRLI